MSFIAVNGDTAQPQAEAGAPVNLRLLSAACLVPVALLLIALGGWAFAALVAAAAAVLTYEWDRLTGGSGQGRAATALGASLLAVVLLAAAGQTAFAAVAVAVGAVLATIAARPDGRSLLWPALGVVWFGLPALALIWLRQEPMIGLAASLWLFVLVWASDSGAYLAGRGIGGPKLAPRISPSKTWAGLIGGMIAGAVVGAGAAAWSGLAPVWLLASTSALIAILSQLGDLAESAVKRHFHVKDSGSLIPGHGGLFDRVDALLFAAPAVAALALWHGGVAASWR